VESAFLVFFLPHLDDRKRDVRRYSAYILNEIIERTAREGSTSQSVDPTTKRDANHPEYSIVVSFTEQNRKRRNRNVEGSKESSNLGLLQYQDEG
jgi:hypothetical protein